MDNAPSRAGGQGGFRRTLRGFGCGTDACVRKRISGCRVQGRRGPGGGAGAEPPLWLYPSPWFHSGPCLEGSRGGFAIAAAAFAAGEGGEGVEGGAWVRVGVEAEVAFGSDAAPVAGEEGAAEEVGPDGEVVEAPFIALGVGCG